MDIIRNADGTLVVPVEPERAHGDENDPEATAASTSACAASPSTPLCSPVAGLNTGDVRSPTPFVRWPWM